MQFDPFSTMNNPDFRLFSMFQQSSGQRHSLRRPGCVIHLKFYQKMHLLNKILM